MEHKISRITMLISFIIMMTAAIPFGYTYEWSPEMRLTWNGETDAHPSMAQASDGKIWVVWESYRTGNADLFYKVYDSSKVHPWSSEKRLTTDTNVDEKPAIMQAKDGKIWVVWSTNRDGNYEIYYKTSSDNGATWSMDLLIPDLTDTNDWDPAITQAADGKIWCVWVRDKDLRVNIWYRTYYYSYLSNKWIWSGGIYSVTQYKPPPEVLNRHPSVMKAKDGKIWIVWDLDIVDGQAEADIYYKTYSPPFSEDIRLTINQGEDSMPSIMQAADGTIWIAWSSWRTGNCDIYYSTTKLHQPHDVAIVSVTPTEVTVNEGGQMVSIEVVAQNRGTYPEYFIVGCYADLALINQSGTIGLSPGQLEPINLTSNALDAGTYKIWANVSAVDGEINTVDNTFPAIIGDANGDRTVNASDLSCLSDAYGSKPGDFNWNPNCNFNGFDGDDKVDAYDLSDLGRNYGSSQ